VGKEKPPGKPIKAVRFGKLWDAKGKVWTNRCDRPRRQVRSRQYGCVDNSPGAEVIDLSRYSGLPGLIDVHTHLTYYTDETPGEAHEKSTHEQARRPFKFFSRAKRPCAPWKPASPLCETSALTNTWTSPCGT